MYPTRRRWVGIVILRSVSVRTEPSMTIRPLCGEIRPAITLTIEVLPAPERPNRAVRPRPLRNCMSSVKDPSRCSISTSSIGSVVVRAPAGVFVHGAQLKELDHQQTYNWRSDPGVGALGGDRRQRWRWPPGSDSMRLFPFASEVTAMKVRIEYCVP